MSNFNNKSITNKGLELLSAAMAGDKLEFTRIVMGSGTYSGDIGVIESLVAQKQSLDIKSITKKGSQVILSTTLLQSAITEDFYWKEIGVYAKGSDGVEVLYMYGSATDTSFISKDMLNEKVINVGVLVSNAQNITATIDGSLVYLSRADLEEHNTSDSAHNDIRELIKHLQGEIENIDVSWEGITGKPSTFPPSEHTHGDLTNLVDRGYLNTKAVTDANLATENGIYLLDVNGANSPNPQWAFTIQTIKQTGYGNRTQIAIAYYPTATPFMYMRISVNDAWGSWKEIATVDKSFTYKNVISNDLTGALNGVYLTNGTGTTNLPTDWSSTGRKTLASFSVGNEEQYDLQLLSDYYSKRLAFRMGSKNAWQEIATTEQTVATKPLILDANKAVDNGVYHYWNNAGMVNFPPNVENIGTLVVFRGNSFPMQLWSTFNGKLFYRARGAGATEWVQWKQLAATSSTVANANKLGGYTLEQIKRMCGGDYVGKQLLPIGRQAMPSGQTFTYSNSKGGVMRVTFPGGYLRYSVTVDNALLVSNREVSDFANTIAMDEGNGNSYRYELMIPFENTVKLTNHQPSGTHYIVPVVYVNK